MRDDVEEGLLNDAQSLIEASDVELMALSLGANEKSGDNYQMAIAIKLRESLDKLNNSMEKAEKSASRNFWIELILSIIVGLATIFIGIIPLIKSGN